MNDFQTHLQLFITKIHQSQRAFCLKDPITGQVAHYDNSEGGVGLYLLWSDRLLAESVLEEHFPLFTLTQITLFELLVDSCCATPNVIQVGFDWSADSTGHNVEGSYLGQCFRDKMSNEMLAGFKSFKTKKLTDAIFECLNNNEIWLLHDPVNGLIAGEFTNAEWFSIFLFFTSQSSALAYRDLYVPQYKLQSIDLYYFLSSEVDRMHGVYWGINWGSIAGITVEAHWFKSFICSLMHPEHRLELQAYQKSEIASRMTRQEQFIDDVIATEQVWYLCDENTGYAFVHSPLNHKAMRPLFWSSKNQAESVRQRCFQQCRVTELSLIDFLHYDIPLIESSSMDSPLGLNFSVDLWCVEVYPALLKNQIEEKMPKAMYVSYQKRLNQNKG